MGERQVAVLDVGKTLAKLSLWAPGGDLIARASRPNSQVEAVGYTALDVAGIEAFIAETLGDFARRGEIGAIVPVGHGAAAAIIKNGALACPPMDYESPIPAAVRAAYDRERDAFADTGSPALPDGLNLGAQLYYLRRLHPDAFAGDAQILPWAQYWAWRLSGVARSEVTSLGCHTDLWRPAENRPSDMAERLGWADRLAPLARAGEVLGTITPDWAARTGLPAAVKIYCGLHDSNAALLAARGFPEIADNDSTVLSTGTWFVAMRRPAGGNLPQLSEARDCLLNVDAFGAAIPSARFMGGREIQTLSGVDVRQLDIRPDQPLLLAALPQVLRTGARVLPSFAPGFGPYPDGQGRWIAKPADAIAVRTAVCLYIALVANTALDLIGARGAILVEGRFAEADVIVRALASLRLKDGIYVSNAHTDVSYGALRLIDPGLSPSSALVRVAPLDEDITAYAEQWWAEVEG
ncbi:MAG: carbohydrate kinase [Caulobacteraceae bacterium]|nr:carbohydrate kinase [Caulobacteraceae bacterium]